MHLHMSVKTYPHALLFSPIRRVRWFLKQVPWALKLMKSGFLWICFLTVVFWSLKRFRIWQKLFTGLVTYEVTPHCRFSHPRRCKSLSPRAFKGFLCLFLDPYKPLRTGASVRSHPSCQISWSQWGQRVDRGCRERQELFCSQNSDLLIVVVVFWHKNSHAGLVQCWTYPGILPLFTSIFYYYTSICSVRVKPCQ